MCKTEYAEGGVKLPPPQDRLKRFSTKSNFSLNAEYNIYNIFNLNYCGDSSFAHLASKNSNLIFCCGKL